MKARLLPAMAALMTLVAVGCTTPPEADSPAKPASETTSSTSETPKTETPASTETKTDAKTESAKPVDPEAVAKEAAKPVAKNATETVATESPKSGDEVGVIETSKGRIIVMFRPDKAPKHVQNFKDLAGKRFYDGTRFHRCIPGFMIQGGDPNSKDKSKAGAWGTGGYVANGKERTVPLEASDLLHTRGVLSMARSQDPDSASSQFFIMHADYPSLDGQYSAFGKVVKGIEVVDKIIEATGTPEGQVDPNKAVVVKSIRIQRWPVK